MQFKNTGETYYNLIFTQYKCKKFKCQVKFSDIMSKGSREGQSSFICYINTWIKQGGHKDCS